MTGISLPGSRQQRPNKVELPGERYTRVLKGVPERYSILQVGVALFHKNPKYKDQNAVQGRDGAHSSGGSHRGLAENENNDEHAYMHREGMLNQDELEDLTEREEDQDNNGDGNNGDKAEEQSEYTSRIYNFFVFPSGKDNEREVTLSPSAVKFLLDNHMDFDKVFREGVPFTTVEHATDLKNKYFKKYSTTNTDEDGAKGEKQNGSTPQKKHRVKLTRVEDIALVARTMAGLREWIDSDNSMQTPLADGAGQAAAAAAAPINGNEANEENITGSVPNEADRQEEGTSLVLPPCNAFLRRCLYETIEDEYPGLILEKTDSYPVSIRAIRLSPAEKKHRETRKRQEAWDKLLLDIGFTTLFQAISDACNGKSFTKENTSGFLNGLCPELSTPTAHSGNGTERKIPLVIHNGLQDLMFLLTHFHNPSLPEAFEDTKKVVRGYFPIVFDTKVLGTEYSDASIKGGNTALGELFNTTCNNGESDDILSLKVPHIVNQDGRSQGQAHEAAWDAFMTGCVFNSLCNRILESKKRLNSVLTLDRLLHNSSDTLLREWIGMNKIYMHVSLFTIDLESSSGPVGLHDPLSRGLSIDTTFHVSGITTSVSTRDILQALWTGNDSEDEVIRELKYEIIWVDDTSFFVGTRMVDSISTDDFATTDLIASHARNKLYGLGNMEISSLGDYFKTKYDVDVIEKPEPVGIFGSLVSVATSPFQVLGSVLGFGKKRLPDDNSSSEGANKRRRLG
mmetsp:Transcript_31305/g.65927  ORF Transcript_31305/g.65927 Transcript_31305/m.65927 type:complete len:738 (+) Transcript_31305:1488-3701(+)